jgi:hypothetical protein
MEKSSAASTLKMPKPHFAVSYWSTEAAHAIHFSIPDRIKHVGYPSPLLLLDLAERAAVVCCGVMKKWHLVFLPRGFALQHLGPLESLLSWSLSSKASITPNERKQLEVGRGLMR